MASMAEMNATLVEHEAPMACEDLISSLRRFSTLDGLTEEEFRWLAENGIETIHEDGEHIFRAGVVLEHLAFVLDGSFQFRLVRSGTLGVFVGRAGQITGKIPFSRMKSAAGDGFAVGRTRAMYIHQSRFPEMLSTIPSMAQRCVSVLLDRVREMTRVEQQADKIASLGKLAANLSHELKNPASAARSAATSLSKELRNYGNQKFPLERLIFQTKAKKPTGCGRLLFKACSTLRSRPPRTPSKQRHGKMCLQSGSSATRFQSPGRLHQRLPKRRSQPLIWMSLWPVFLQKHYPQHSVRSLP